MLLMLVISGVIGYAIYENTLSEWWIPVGVALMIAVVTFPFYMKWAWLTNNNDKLVNLGYHLVCVGVMSYALFLAGNYWLADPASEQKEEVIVQKKYQKTHQKRRGTRRRYKSVGVRVWALLACMPTINRRDKNEERTVACRLTCQPSLSLNLNNSFKIISNYLISIKKVKISTYYLTLSTHFI